MGIFSTWWGEDNSDADMARANSKPLDTKKIDEMVRLLRSSVQDATSFKSIQDTIAADRSLSAQDVIAIAQGFSGGVRLKSKKAALSAIGQERLRVSHAKAKAESAAKTRTW